jgi:hypothetical protein
VRHLARVAGLADDPAARAQRLAHQVVMHRAGREQHRDRSQVWRYAAVRQDQDVHAAAHRALGLRTQAIERRLKSRAALGRLEQARELARAELGQRDVLELRELLVGDHGMLDPDHPSVRLGLLEQVALGAERGEQRHHRAAR